MLRPFDPRQLGLWADPDEVKVYAVMGNRYAGPTLLVHTPTLMRRMTELSESIETLVFLDEPLPSRSTIEKADQMLAQFARRNLDAIAGYVGSTEALKRVDAERVLTGVDRSMVIAVASPLIVSRAKLDEALRELDDIPQWDCPFLLVARVGGDVGVFEARLEQQRPHPRT
jgi:hypothetical protein